MSWTAIESFFSRVAHSVFSVANLAQPYAGQIAMVPVVGGPADIVLQAILAIEKLVPASPGATQNGAVKKALVTSIVNASVATPIAPAKLSTSINALVAQLNALEAEMAKITAT